MPYIMMLLSLFASDSFIKAYIEKNKEPGMAEPLLNGKIIIKRTHNTGAMLNLGEGKQHYIALLSLVFSAFVSGIFAATFGSKKKKMLKTGLALILGGAYSNTYDRLKRKYVVDYVSFGMYPKIVFNLADFGIIIGSVLFVLSELCKKEENLYSSGRYLHLLQIPYENIKVVGHKKIKAGFDLRKAILHGFMRYSSVLAEL